MGASGRSRGRSRTARAGQRARRPGLAHLEQVRVLAHPLRLRLYELFALAPRTTMQAATELGQPPTRLYHHVAELERVGLVRLRETRPNRGAVEKYYEAAHQSLAAPAPRGIRLKAGRLDRASAGQLRDTVALGALVLDRTREEFVRALGAIDEGCDPLELPLLARIVVGTKPEHLVRVRKVVKKCLERLMALGGSREVRPGETPWAITLAMIPAGDSALPAPARGASRDHAPGRAAAPAPRSRSDKPRVRRPRSRPKR